MVAPQNAAVWGADGFGGSSPGGIRGDTDRPALQVRFS